MEGMLCPSKFSYLGYQWVQATDVAQSATGGHGSDCFEESGFEGSGGIQGGKVNYRTGEVELIAHHT